MTNQPATAASESRALTVAEREALVRAAILAPSMHNTQPWRFRFTGRVIEVHRDPRYDLPAEDAQGRMAMISIGAAVFNLRVAAARLGYGVSVTMCGQDSGSPTRVAEVSVPARRTPRTIGVTEQAALAPYLAVRRTSREPFAGIRVPDQAKVDLVFAAAAEGAVLEWVSSPVRRGWLLTLAADGVRLDAADPARVAERLRWVGGDRAAEGIPAASLGPRPHRLYAPARDLGGSHGGGRPSAQFEREPTLGVISTRDDTPMSRFQAGQALQRVLLTATRLGLSTGLLTQAIEHPELRWLVRDPLGPWAEPQTVLRVGYGPDMPPTPRRAPESFVDR